MSDSEGEFQCSQYSVRDYGEANCSQFGLDVIDSDGENQENVVSLEGENVHKFDEVREKCSSNGGERVLYDNVLIEDILSDEELELM